MVILKWCGVLGGAGRNGATVQWEMFKVEGLKFKVLNLKP
jgi:hypothetical protein